MTLVVIGAASGLGPRASKPVDQANGIGNRRLPPRIDLPGRQRRTMPGDPQECRENARRCTELAAVAKSPPFKQLLTGLARSWIEMAVQLERAQAVKEINQIGSKPQTPIKG